jgi:hypothetical protein
VRDMKPIASGWYITKIEELEPALVQKGANAGGEFLRLRLRGIGWAKCFMESIHPLLYTAFGSGVDITLQIVASEKLDGKGRPYLNVEGLAPESVKLLTGQVPT